MIPFILTIVGGYLIGDSMKESGNIFADGGVMADGGAVPYVLWVSKDGQKRELYGNYKSKRAAEMAMKKLWNSGADYKEMGNGPKSEYDKHGLWFADGGKMADGGLLKLYNLASERQKLLNSLRTASPDKKKDIQKKIDDIEAKMDQVKPYAEGGSIAEGNNQMLRSKVKEVKHHADELGKSVKPKTEVEAWVVAKAERSASDLSDITHYLEGKHK